MEPEEVLLLSPQYRSGHRKATASSHQVPIGSSFSSSSSSPWTTSGAGLGGRGGYSTYNIGATQQWDLNDRCAAEVPEAVPVDICEALKIWRQPKAFELQARRRYTVLLRRGPLKGEGSGGGGGGGSSKGDKGGRTSGPERRAHERFRIVIGIDFYNSSSAERRHAIENWKFLEQEQAFGLATGGQKSTSQKSSPPPRLFEVFPNGNTTSVDFFEFNEEDQQHSCFWSPENVRTFRDGHRGHGGDDDEELHYDPDCSSTCTSFDLQFNCLTEHFANFMEIGENPMRLMIKSSSSGGRHSSTDSKTAMIASDRPQRFEYAKVAKLSCGVRILDSDSGEAMNDKTSDTNPE
ncbi:hypothetical protein TYRP_003085 [Tyrophagus putrescentiae]|nr:hypothetical protein TYRP_003085 [Tyrophagus putrescentiae]